MEQQSAIEEIKKVCNAISLELMRLHPAAAALGDKEAADELYRTLYELTKQVEIIKKQMRKLESRLAGSGGDEPPEL